MSVDYQDLYNTFKEMTTAAKQVQNETADEYTKESMAALIEHATEMRGELEGIRPDDDTAAAVRNSRIPELQNTVGQEVMSVLTHSGRPPQAKNSFEDLLQLAKESEELVLAAEGGQETMPVLKQA